MKHIIFTLLILATCQHLYSQKVPVMEPLTGHLRDHLVFEQSDVFTNVSSGDIHVLDSITYGEIDYDEYESWYTEYLDYDQYFNPLKIRTYSYQEQQWKDEVVFVYSSHNKQIEKFRLIVDSILGQTDSVLLKKWLKNDHYNDTLIVNYEDTTIDFLKTTFTYDSLQRVIQYRKLEFANGQPPKQLIIKEFQYDSNQTIFTSNEIRSSNASMIKTFAFNHKGMLIYRTRESFINGVGWNMGYDSVVYDTSDRVIKHFYHNDLIDNSYSYFYSPNKTQPDSAFCKSVKNDTASYFYFNQYFDSANRVTERHSYVCDSLGLSATYLDLKEHTYSNYNHFNIETIRRFEMPGQLDYYYKITGIHQNGIYKFGWAFFDGDENVKSYRSCLYDSVWYGLGYTEAGSGHYDEVNYYTCDFSINKTQLSNLSLLNVPNIPYKINRYDNGWSHSSSSAEFIDVEEFHWSLVSLNSVENSAKNNASFLVYPNPTSGIVNIDVKKANGVLKVYDTTGRVVAEMRINQFAQINLQSFNSGFYYFEFVNSEGGQKGFKLLKH